MKKIKLTQSKFALVDDADFEWLNQWKWCINKKYANRVNWDKKLKIYKSIYMHKLILPHPKGLYTDHINRNSLDNRRENLRIVTNQQNAFNTKNYITNKSGTKGVHWDRFTKKWRAEIGFNYKMIKLGRFLIIEDAIKARIEAERTYHAI